MTVRELREKYLRFFESKGHQRHASGSLVPYDVTGKLDESLLFNGAGMVQFKPYFRGVASPPCPRLTNSQKCVRTGDIDDVGDLSHLTFFEMLGNFSFGDYFKKEAIAYSWEFLTSKEWLGLDPKRLAFTVFEEDDEAFGHWAKHFESVGIDPSTRIFRLTEETNYWPAGAFSSGPPGPCGPNSEMFFWTPNDEPPPAGPYTREDYIRDEKAAKWLEIWNDVFIQFEWKGALRDPSHPGKGYAKEGMDPLPFRSVDTGMGLERTAAVLAGHDSVYDTDLFQPILRTIESVSQSGLVYGVDPEKDRAIRIIADHIRTACFCIADGILPSNAGRGYVLRRLIRRAVLKGQRVLGFDEPFFHKVFEGVRQVMGDHFTELNDRRETIVETLQNEETQFRRTVAQGAGILNEHLDEWRAGSMDKTTPLSGDVVFRLYDTFGFPLEVTAEICAEEGVEIDIEGYEEAMRQAQERSRGSDGMANVYAEQEDLVLAVSDAANTETVFVGYDQLECEAKVAQVSPRFGPDGLTNGELQVCLDRTPFYAESGGQVGDTGSIICDAFEMAVVRTWKEMGLVWHDATLVRGPHLQGLDKAGVTGLLNSGVLFHNVTARVDAERRKAITRNHTATHLLHAALRSVLGKHVTQAGSLVAPDYLRFDFTHGKAMSQQEIAEVERIVNERTLDDRAVLVHQDLAIDKAREMGAMALFGEKYGDRVRMIEVDGFSRELCGGCHVGRSGEIGLFKITNEASAASGVRRIEAVTGTHAYDWVNEQQATLREVAGLLKAPSGDLVGSVEKLVEQLREERKRREKAEAAMVRGGASSSEEKAEVYEPVGGVRLWVKRYDAVDPKVVAGAVDDAVANHADLVVVAAIVNEGRVNLVCKVGPEAQSQGAHAGNIVREVAKVVGGGGGGRPDFATAGGKDPSKVAEALAHAKGVLSQQVGA